MTIGLNVDVHARRKSWCACASIIEPGCASDLPATIIRPSPRLLSQGKEQGLLVLMGIGTSTKANDAICMCLRHPDRCRGALAIEAGMHVTFVRVLFQFMRDGCHGLGASCISL